MTSSMLILSKAEENIPISSWRRRYYDTLKTIVETSDVEMDIVLTSLCQAPQVHFAMIVSGSPQALKELAESFPKTIKTYSITPTES